MTLRLQVSALDDPTGRVFRYEFDDDRAQILLGRRGGVDVLLPQPSVSLVHARIERRGAGYYLVDDGSTNGTRVNGVRISSGRRVPLAEGDRIAIGDFTVQVSLAAKLDWRAESSGSIARHMAREILERLGPGDTLPSLVVLDGPQSGVVLTLGELGRTYVVGRAGRGDLRLDDVDVWRERAALVRDAEGVTIRDLGATPPVLLNGQRLDGARLLHDGDIIVLGGTSLRFRDPAEVYLRQLESAADEPAAPPSPTAAVAPPSPSPPPPEVPADANPGAPITRRVNAQPRRARPEVLIAVAALAAAALAAAALVWVLRWW
jgi:pSer/pThr/pTyr-binding forkhead associated (FHA) protein